MLIKKILSTIAIVTSMALTAALVSQHVFDMQPCPWCILQRALYLLILIIAVLGLLLPRLAKLMLGLTTISGVVGASIALYQINVAAQSFSCDQTLADQWITASGLDVMAPWFFGVYASCMDAVVEVLGIEYATWSLMLFIALAIASAITLWINCRSQQNLD